MVFPKPETIDFDLPCDTSYPHQFGVCLTFLCHLESLKHPLQRFGKVFIVSILDVQDNAASSSGSNVKSLLIEMGFCPTLVQKAIDENGTKKNPTIIFFFFFDLMKASS